MSLEITRQKLKGLLKDNLFNRYTISKRGLLNGNKIFSYKTSSRLFKKKQEQSGQKYNIDILIDYSGSMKGSRFTIATSVTKDIIKLFNGIVDFRIIGFNLKEIIMDKNKFLSTDFSNYGYIDLGKDDLFENNIDGKSIFDYQSNGPISSCQGNREIINIANSFEYLQKTKGKNFIIIIGDGVMNIDDYSQEELINKNFYISGKPVKNYNKGNASQIVSDIEKKGVKVLGLNIAGRYNYIKNSYSISSSQDAYIKIIDFLKENIK